MRRNSDRGTLRSMTWSSAAFDREAIRVEADRRFDARDYS
jgi:hypothetical protein